MTTATSARTAPVAGGRVSYEEFLRDADEDVRAEWVDGEVIQMSPASKRHQGLADFLTALLLHFVQAHELGEILSAPFQMKTGPDLPGREPDVLFVARDNLDRLGDTYLAGPADLVVEIVSPESRGRDRGDKFYEYEKGGVREYWLLDPERRQAELYRLTDRGIFEAIPLSPEGRFESAVLPGLWLEPDWLWQEPLPPLLEILQRWGLL